MLARAQSGEAVGPPVPVDLRAAVADAVEQVRTHRRRARRGTSTSCAATVPGEPDLLARAVANLVGNAAHHNVPGGRVEVALTVEPGTARVTVENTGPVVPPDAAADLVLPFRRAPPPTGPRPSAASGSGSPWSRPSPTTTAAGSS